MRTIAAAGAILMLGMALPAAAQVPPPPPGDAGPDGPGPGRGRGHHGMREMFASMSEAGRRRMMNAMRSADPRADYAATHAARDRMLTILDADRLDVGALKRAMDDERETANSAKMRHQATFLAAFQQLSLADRKAFVADARALRARMESRMNDPKSMRGRRAMGGGMPPAPPPQ